MDQALLCDRIARGLGAAARRIGAPHDLHRPTGAREPMAPATRILRLNRDTPEYSNAPVTVVGHARLGLSLGQLPAYEAFLLGGPQSVSYWLEMQHPMVEAGPHGRGLRAEWACEVRSEHMQPGAAARL